MGESLNLKYLGALIHGYLGVPSLILGMLILVVLLSLPGRLFAQEEPSECVELGGLAWDNWTKEDSGGSEMSDGEREKASPIWPMTSRETCSNQALHARRRQGTS